MKAPRQRTKFAGKTVIPDKIPLIIGRIARVLQAKAWWNLENGIASSSSDARRRDSLRKAIEIARLLREHGVDIEELAQFDFAALQELRKGGKY